MVLLAKTQAEARKSAYCYLEPLVLFRVWVQRLERSARIEKDHGNSIVRTAVLH